MENLRNEMFVWDFENLEHTPINIEGHLDVQAFLQAPGIPEQVLRFCLFGLDTLYEQEVKKIVVEE